ncbi:MAG: pectin acetylesterase-family hydrolase [Myxococcota bacterium]|nr:pectin acetylesterase-family hydrolase [Myxococcota bacterium]
MSIRLPILSLALAVAVLGAGAANAAPYPSDTCVADRLQAAARACKSIVNGTDFATGDVRPGRVAKARTALETAWSDTAAAAQGTCSEASATPDELLDLFESGASALAGAVSATSPACASEARRWAAQSCKNLLRDWGNHLADRENDRLRTGLDAALDLSSRKIEARLAAGAPSCDATDRADVASAVEVLATSIRVATTTTSSVGSAFVKISPGDSVDYMGQTYEPRCSAGGPYSFWVRRGTENKLLMYYQGGGACWENLTCNGIPGLTGPTFKTNTSDNDNPDNFTSGFADLDNPDNPFRDWNVVFVPYCTGDVHWGNEVVDHTGPFPITIHHKGYANAQTAEKWAREHFVLPDQVFVTGSSAGSYGAIVNSLPLQEFAYPSTEFVVLGDAGNGVITESFLRDNLAIWGIEENLPTWIPAFDVPITQLDAADLWAESAKFYSQNRFATYTTAYDGGGGGQTGFYNVMLEMSPVGALRWWEASCAWNEEMLDLNDKAGASAGNFRSYVGSGSAHTMWGRNKVYTDTTGNVPTIRDWVEDMLQGNSDWQDVLCTDCTTVLPGDPKPNPLQLPFVADDRIDCSATAPPS